MFGLGAGEILVILLMGIIFIGPKKLPELAQNIGKMIREFQKTKDSVMESLQNIDDGAGPDDDDKIAQVKIEEAKIEHTKIAEQSKGESPKDSSPS